MHALLPAALKGCSPSCDMRMRPILRLDGATLSHDCAFVLCRGPQRAVTASPTKDVARPRRAPKKRQTRKFSVGVFSLQAYRLLCRTRSSLGFGRAFGLLKEGEPTWLRATRCEYVRRPLPHHFVCEWKQFTLPYGLPYLLPKRAQPPIHGTHGSLKYLNLHTRGCVQIS